MTKAKLMSMEEYMQRSQKVCKKEQKEFAKKHKNFDVVKHQTMQLFYSEKGKEQALNVVLDFVERLAVDEIHTIPTIEVVEFIKKFIKISNDNAERIYDGAKEHFAEVESFNNDSKLLGDTINRKIFAN